MNEVRPTQPMTQLTTVKPVSTRDSGVETGKQDALDGGKSLPAAERSTTDAQQKAANNHPLNLKDAVADMNKYVQKVSRDLHFSVDDDSGRTVIRVVDRASGDLIRQIPEDIFLDLARNLKDDEPIHLVNAHG